jgi:hypothetical protein
MCCNQIIDLDQLRSVVASGMLRLVTPFFCFFVLFFYQVDDVCRFVVTFTFDRFLCVVVVVSFLFCPSFFLSDSWSLMTRDLEQTKLCKPEMFHAFFDASENVLLCLLYFSLFSANKKQSRLFSRAMKIKHIQRSVHFCLQHEVEHDECKSSTSIYSIRARFRGQPRFVDAELKRNFYALRNF